MAALNHHKPYNIGIDGYVYCDRRNVEESNPWAAHDEPSGHDDDQQAKEDYEWLTYRPEQYEIFPAAEAVNILQFAKVWLQMQ